VSDGVTRVAAAVVVHEGRVLVQTRPPGSHYAGFWEFPGGKIERGEDAGACAVRECHEELGLPVRVREDLIAVDWAYPGRRVRVTFILCDLEPGHAPEPRAIEGQAVRWADGRDLAELEFLPADAEVLKLLRARRDLARPSRPR
jgi:8-oxo-dGTP diphosphatase